LVLDPEAAPVVRRIFAEFIAGHGFYAIAEGLTRDGIPSPSAHDPARNRHRCGIAWNKFAVRAILVDPRYTGHQVWSKQRKDEVLIDVDDVTLGHTTKLRVDRRDRSRAGVLRTRNASDYDPPAHERGRDQGDR